MRSIFLVKAVAVAPKRAGRREDDGAGAQERGMALMARVRRDGVELVRGNACFIMWSSESGSDDVVVVDMTKLGAVADGCDSTGGEQRRALEEEVDMADEEALLGVHVGPLPVAGGGRGNGRKGGGGDSCVESGDAEAPAMSPITLGRLITTHSMGFSGTAGGESFVSCAMINRSSSMTTLNPAEACIAVDEGRVLECRRASDEGPLGGVEGEARGKAAAMALREQRKKALEAK